MKVCLGLFFAISRPFIYTTDQRNFRLMQIRIIGCECQWRVATTHMLAQKCESFWMKGKSEYLTTHLHENTQSIWIVPPRPCNLLTTVHGAEQSCRNLFATCGEICWIPWRYLIRSEMTEREFLKSFGRTGGGSRASSNCSKVPQSKIRRHWLQCADPARNQRRSRRARACPCFAKGEPSVRPARLFTTSR